MPFMECPFCKETMKKGYLSVIGDGSRIYFSEERISYATGGLGKKKEKILEGGAFALAWEGDYSRTAYRCDTCGAVVIGGGGSAALSGEGDSVEDALKKIDSSKENIRDRTV